MKTMFCFLVGLASLVGCNSPYFNQHAQIADTARGTIEALKSELGPDSIGQLLANAHINNPGIRAGGGVEYYGYVRYEGVDANVSGAASGKLDRPLTPEVEKRITEVSQSTTLNAREKREAIMKLLEPVVEKFTTTQPMPE